VTSGLAGDGIDGGGTAVTVNGTNFVSGATVMGAIGGVAATNVAS